MTTTFFTQLATTSRAVLSPEAEQALILEARAGDNPAVRQLLANYLPLLKSLVGERYRTANGTAQMSSTLLDDLQSAAVTAFFDALRDFDSLREERLGGILKVYIRRSLYEEVGNTLGGMTIPATMRKRFASVLAAAGGDRAAARELAPEYGLTTASYDAIARAYQMSASMSLESAPGEGDDFRDNPSSDQEPEASPLVPRSYVIVEDVWTARRAMEALDATEALVVEALYGMDGEVQTEREAAEALGIPRSTLQRVHKRALAKMHSRIA